MVGPQPSTARQRESDRLKEAWEKKSALRAVALRERYIAGFRGFDDLGEPIIDGLPEKRSLRGPELVEALHRALVATGDPVFDDALRAVKAYGFDQGGHKAVYQETWGNADSGYLEQIRYLSERRRMSSRAATEHVVSEFGVPGSSFESTVDRLRKKFDIWRNADYLAESLNYEAGHLGYEIHIETNQEVSLETLTKCLPTQGPVQPSTAWWRRLFRDGVISIRYLGEK